MRYHYVITLQAPIPNGGSAVNTVTGTITLVPGTTRASAYEEVLSRAVGTLGDRFRTDNSVTLFFSLEPDELTSPASGGDS
jgi:hypothetical protein